MFFAQMRLYSAFVRSSAQKLKPGFARETQSVLSPEKGPHKAPSGIIRNVKGPDCRAFHRI